MFFQESVFPSKCKILTNGPVVGGVQYYQFGGFVNALPQNNDKSVVRFAGIEAYIVGNGELKVVSHRFATELTTADFDASQLGRFWSPVQMLADLQSLQDNTPGLAAQFALLPDFNNTNHSWLRVDKTMINQFRGASPIWQKTEVLWYNTRGWDTAIYSDANLDYQDPDLQGRGSW